jgi:hypothetical protein
MLANTRIAEYVKARRPEFHKFHNGITKTFQAKASMTLRNIKTRAEWRTWEVGEHDTAELGSVRLRVVPDDSVDLDDLFGDTFNHAVNDDIRPEVLDKQRREEVDRVERDGVWGVIGEYWNGEEWERVDSCFGFVGDDWRDSGYDIDIMRATLDKMKSKLADVLG